MALKVMSKARFDNIIKPRFINQNNIKEECSFSYE